MSLSPIPFPAGRGDYGSPAKAGSMFHTSASSGRPIGG